ncbi:YbaK/EbsC family protein [Desulforamulus ruminis]|uniref:YbaK/prolyl-tRNA synthetase associated region n=1 Tax=Desulforamulus ruminis (strain ATCC 23193 / DSM 2154 / NCIMB 8452 / DL) TaxID=696281 RepID=F6DRI4_DESRL|nr:YbaK/EbsC family protein [Desulforamulus ruminis]AEG58738.1 YbaK/prolyl-tRNA synthetase associated region [Desulforamulus ruminis DSM 2154]
MSIEAVREYFKKWHMEDRIQELPLSSATVEEAARALQCEEKRIAKTMSFLVNDQAILIVMAGDAKIDNAKYKAQFHTKAVMLKPDQVVGMIGHPAGGVCPFGIKDDIKVYLDESLKRFETVFPACGSRNSAIELTLPELEKYSGYCEWINICKGWE